MSFDWNKIGEKISVLYQEMEFHSEYNIEQFENDILEILNTPKKWKNSGSLPDETNLCSNWFSQLRESLESHRSILTKLFSFTNNPNGVDTLMEYCDHFKSYYDKQRIDYIPIKLDEDPQWIAYTVFLMLATNETTKGVLTYVWRMLVSFDMSLCVNFTHSRHTAAMVIMADADLNAAIQALIRSRGTYFEISRVFVQEPIKEQFLYKIKNYQYKNAISPNLYVFRYTTEAVGNLNGKDKFNAVSIWSENIIGAKKSSSNIESGTVWINAHGAIAASLYSLVYRTPCNIHNALASFNVEVNEESPKTQIKISKIYDLFYGGKWQIPVDRKYWTNPDGNSFAQATEKDVVNCVDDALKAFKLWRSKKLSQRLKIVKSFADRLVANGQSELADLILQIIERSWEYYTSLSIVGDGEAEITTTSEPVGVVLSFAKSFDILFVKVITAVITGNAVIILSNSKECVSFAPYCDLLGSCSFPSGVISSLFIGNSSIVKITEKIVDTVLPSFEESSLVENSSNLYGTMTEKCIIHKDVFLYVTKPKCVWLQCD